MSQVSIVDAAGKKTGTVELPGSVFDVVANVPLIHQVVVAQLAAARQGTHKVKNRGEVSGSGRKPFKQKGTGRARQGSGAAHAVRPREYSQRTPKKMIKAALAGALSDRARNERIHVLEAFGANPNTKSAIAAARQFSDRKNLLVVLARTEDVAWRSLRNADNVHLLVPDQLNAYDILKSDDVIFTDAAIKDFLSGNAKGKGAKAVASASEIESELENA